MMKGREPTMTAYSLDALKGLVRPDRVHRDIYQDPAIFELEMERIFGRVWVYIGHESQVPARGDFVCTWLGAEPVVMVRHTDGRVYVLHNRCGHRGVKVINEAAGNAPFLRCMYHGWTYQTNGELAGVTQPDGYPDDVELDPVAYGMPKVAQVESYHGFVFARAVAEGPSLKNYLGGVLACLDDLAASAPDGEVEVTGGVVRYGYPGNWKFQLDNVCDMYHPAYSHESSSRKGGRQYTRREGDEDGIKFFEDSGEAVSFDSCGLWSFPNGHGWEGALPQVENTSPVHREYVALLEAKHGPRRTGEILTKKRHNTVFYPNVVIQDLNLHVRVIRPVAVDLTEVAIYPIRLKGAPEQMFRDSIRLLNTTNSPASMTQVDDVEAFRRAHIGLKTRHGSPWLFLARGGHVEELDPETGGTRSIGSSETLLRNQYQTWLGHMMAGV